MTNNGSRLLVALLLWSAGAHGALALEWRPLVDTRYDLRIEYPTDLFWQVERTDEGVTATGSDARLEMSARRVEGMTDARQLRALIEKQEGYENIAYSPSGDRWLVVSGYRDEDIFYEKFLIDGELIRGFSVQYPAKKRQLYDPIVDRMEDSFGGPGG